MARRSSQLALTCMPRHPLTFISWADLHGLVVVGLLPYSNTRHEPAVRCSMQTLLKLAHLEYHQVADTSQRMEHHHEDELQLANDSVRVMQGQGQIPAPGPLSDSLQTTRS